MCVRQSPRCCLLASDVHQWPLRHPKTLFLTVAGTAVGAGLAARIAAHGHAREAWDLLREMLPDPDAQPFEAGLLEGLDFIQHSVIERAAKGAAGRFDLIELHHKSGRRVGRTAHRDLDLERMPVHAPVRVTHRKRIEAMGGVEAEGVSEFDDRRAHGIPSSLWTCKLRRQRGCALQYSSASRVFDSRVGPSIGRREKYPKSSTSKRSGAASSRE